MFDFDGVFTDNRVLVGQDGTEDVVHTRGRHRTRRAQTRTRSGARALNGEKPGRHRAYRTNFGSNAFRDATTNGRRCPRS